MCNDTHTECGYYCKFLQGLTQQNVTGLRSHGNGRMSIYYDCWRELTRCVVFANILVVATAAPVDLVGHSTN